MIIFDSTRPKRRMLDMVHKDFFQVINGTLIRLHRDLPSLNIYFGWVPAVCVLLLLTISGCGRNTEELDTAKRNIEKLNSEVQKLTEEGARLNQEKNRLGDDVNALSDKNTRMHKELEDLNKTKTSLSLENRDIKKKNNINEEEIASLKRENAKLSQKLEELEKKSTDISPPPEKTSVIRAGDESGLAKQEKELSPCDHVIAFMKASEGIVKQHTGTERTHFLEQVKQEYDPKMKGAPESAIKAAEAWVKEGTKFWDRVSDDDLVFRLLKLRNTVLDTCEKTPRRSGF